MFCREPIVSVYERRLQNGASGSNAYLQIVGSFEYHIVGDYWIVLQTQNYAITLGADGVRLWDSLQSAVPNQEELEELHAQYGIIPEEYTIFIGERVCSVKPGNRCWEICFSNFSMMLYIHGEQEWKWYEHTRGNVSYRPLAVGQHMLNRKCNCGGEGRILLDHVCDYLVRCDCCHSSTYSHMNLIHAIDQWNAGETPVECATPEEDFTGQLRDKPICYIGVSEQGFRLWDDNQCDTESVIVAFTDSFYRIACVHTAQDSYDFTVEQLCGYNPELYGMRITSWEGEAIQGLGFEENEFGRKLRFLVDGSHLLLIPGDSGLMVGFTAANQNGEYHTLNRTVLFKNKQGG